MPGLLQSEKQSASQRLEASDGSTRTEPWERCGQAEEVNSCCAPTDLRQRTCLRRDTDGLQRRLASHKLSCLTWGDLALHEIFVYTELHLEVVR